MTKVITLTGLKQVDELPKGTKCTPVEDATMSGDKVIRCKEDVAVLEATAPAKLATLGRVTKKRHRRKPLPKNRTCVPEWVAMRMRGGKMSERCRCRGGRLTKSERCGKR